uniref:Uncharacterized protein n=1 Tax=Rousettus aegyptiacus TaxID=9407 RepID=A0A7J8CIJ2_ROUAE|nr:hypothetical protein HJG63_009143 [Rousettus aegyptiacus]
MCLFRSCGFHVCDRQPGAASWPVAMSTHQPELCCLAELVHLAFCCVEGAHPHVSPKASLSLRASDMCFPCAGFGGSGWRSRFFLQEFDRVGSMGRVVQPHWVWRSPQEAARCWRTPPSPTQLSAGCSGNGVRLHALLQPPQTRFPGDFPCDCLF